MTSPPIITVEHPAGWLYIRGTGEVSASDLRTALAGRDALPVLLDVAAVTTVDAALPQWWDRSPHPDAAEPVLIAVAAPEHAEAVAQRLGHTPVPWPTPLQAVTLPTEAKPLGMSHAIGAAVRAFQRDEVPVGACLLAIDTEPPTLLAVAGNEREARQDPLAHAEVLAIRAAQERVGSWRFTETLLCVTLEPCPMCAGMILQARIPRVAFGAWDAKAGAMGSLYDLHDDARLNHRVAVSQGLWEEACAGLLREFFRRKRLLGKK